MYCKGSLGQLENCFGMDKIGFIEISSCDGLQIGGPVYSLDHDIAYPRLEGFVRVVFDPGG